MTIKESILRSLDELKGLSTYSEVYDFIVKHGYYDFGTGKTPKATISAQMGEFIRNKDSRVKRIKTKRGYQYYLTKNEQAIDIRLLSEISENQTTRINPKSYQERDLHVLLSTYLKNTQIYSKTIFHEQSKSGKDNNQIWTHPDMIGIKFLKLQTEASKAFLNLVNRSDSFKISSYELKREINSDTELKKAYFQAVSNSSWANYGYLVAFEFSDNLRDEMERLNQSFGIGIIELNSNPYQSEILFQARFKELDFKTIDKLCAINGDFERFLELTDNLMKADHRYYDSTEIEFDKFCDNYFKNDSEIKDYAKEKNIPHENSDQ